MSKTYYSFVGRTGRDPEFKPTKAGEVAKFGVARKTGYNDGDREWINVAVFNEGIQSRLRAGELPKGSLVAIEGWLEEDTYQGQPQKNVVADVVALLEVFTPTRKNQSAPVAVASTGGYSEDV